MNWFKRYQELKIAQATADMQNILGQINHLADQITEELRQAGQYKLDPNLIPLFNSCRQSAKGVVRNLQARNIPAAAEQIEQGLTLLDQICKKVDCAADPVWQNIRQSFQNCWNLINQL